MSWPQWLVVDNELGGAPASWGVDAANAVSGRPTDPGGASGDRREKAAVSADGGDYVRYCTYGAAPRKYRHVVMFQEHVSDRPPFGRAFISRHWAAADCVSAPPRPSAAGSWVVLPP